MAAPRISSASTWVLARRLSVVRFAASATKVAWSAASATSWAASSCASFSPGLCRTLGTDGVLVDVRGVDQRSSGLVVRGAGLGPHGGHLGLDIGPKVIGKVLRPGQQQRRLPCWALRWSRPCRLICRWGLRVGQSHHR